MEKTIVLSSTQKGYISDYFWAIIWSVGLWIFASWCCSFYETMMDSYAPFQFLVFIFGVLTYIAIAAIALYNIHSAIYKTRTVDTFYLNDKGYWNKLSSNSYGFPFSKSNKQVVFDRIIHIDVDQGSICRILNTGILKVKMITFTNADSKEEDWNIYGIKNPYDRKAELEKALLDHEGLMVKMSADK
ncbi:hypothetical protein C0583_05935 [Candidatus Parcubacteria bacterium]|nr:MAG: hypothetical protein C0583_05935 [Candidatus Parcubacteria bacterium]